MLLLDSCTHKFWVVSLATDVFPLGYAICRAFRRFVNPGRRILRLYLSIFLHAHANLMTVVKTSQMVASPTDQHGEILETLLSSHALGRDVASRWQLDGHMIWRQVVSRTNAALSVVDAEHALIRRRHAAWQGRSANGPAQDFRRSRGSHLGRNFPAICGFSSVLSRARGQMITFPPIALLTLRFSLLYSCLTGSGKRSAGLQFSHPSLPQPAQRAA